MSKDNNPYTKDSTENPTHHKDAYWDRDSEDVLQDAYLMLRDGGHSTEELAAFGAFIQQTTTFDVETMEDLHERNE